jgi:hypothetical protein
VNIFGQTQENIMDNGKITKCMEKAYLLGLMASLIKVL